MKVNLSIFLKTINLFSEKIQNLFQKTKEANSQLKFQLLQFLPFIVASIICGGVAYFYAKLFVYSEKLSLYIYDLNPLNIFLLTPTCFLISWWLVKKFAPYANGSGIPQVMAAIELAKPSKTHLVDKLLNLKVLIIKILSSIIKVMGGGIVGREGPTIQISGSIFASVYKYLPTWWPPLSKKNVLIAGAASGLAAAFNTPLGGIIFAIEELSKFHVKHYQTTLFVAVIFAGLTAQGLGGSYLYLGYPSLSIYGWKVFLGVFLTAIVAGYFGSKMCVYLLRFIKFVSSIKNNHKQALIAILCGLILAGVIYFLGIDAMGSGKTLMERTLFNYNKEVSWYIPFVRMGGLISTFGFGGAGGMFAPSLSTGASFGAVISQLIELTGSNANLLILIGMTAFLTGVTRAPFTSTIIVFEMTDRHSVIFFLMLGSLLANMIAYLVTKKPFYEQLKENYIIKVEKL